MSRPGLRTGRGRRRGPVPQISRDDVVDAALQLGLQDVTMREVAEHLGVSVQGLYHYVRTREDLLGAAAARLVGRVTLPAADHPSWVDWMLACAMAIWDELDRHPGVAEVSLLAPARDGGEELARRSVAILHDHYGLPVHTAALAIISVGTTVFAHHAQAEATGADHLTPSRIADDPEIPFPPGPRELVQFTLRALLTGIDMQSGRAGDARPSA